MFAVLTSYSPPNILESVAYTIRQAKDHLSRLLKEAEAGHEVILTRGNKPVAKIVSITSAPQAAQDAQFRLMGAYAGRIRWDEDAFDSMTDIELVDSGLGYMLGAPLVRSSSK